MSALPENTFGAAANDPDALETREWLDALSAVIASEGGERAHFLLEQLIDQARQAGIDVPFSANTAYVNTIPTDQEERTPGNIEIEERLRAYMRWNAMAMVVKANRLHPADGGDLGGHISSFASLATMFGTGFNHFWHAETADHGGDLLYIQGHSSPGVYARAFMEGRLTEEQLLNFRQEVDGKGISSYPHPKLMPEFWQFPTVSMGLGPLMAIYQARFLKYLHARGIADTAKRKVWVFCGDGEMDEPESLGAIGLAAREKLDNLIFVINCNLQRLDGPGARQRQDHPGARERVPRLGLERHQADLGQLLGSAARARQGRHPAQGDDGHRRRRLPGDEGQRRRLRPQALLRPGPEAARDGREDERRGHLAPATAAATTRRRSTPRSIAPRTTKGQPTVLLVKTVKGFGMGKSGEGKNTAHQTKKLVDEDVHAFRDRWNIPIPDDKLGDIPFYKPADDTPEMKYLHERRKALGGYLPHRRTKADEQLKVPPLDTFKAVLEATAEGREISTTQAFVRFLTQLLRDKELGPRAVPILVDEARTFGMEGLFRQIGIYNPAGQNYTPVDRDQVMYYREDKAGQVLQEGINEPGGMSSWIAAATSYSTNNRIMVPFYVYYSMFGFQRVGDLAWAAGDMQARGFLLGGTSGRTTLNGEGLQHEDGHSHILAGTIPNCISYDPTFAHEVGVILHHGLVRMVEKQDNVYFYLTLLNENYPQPGLRAGTERRSSRACTCCRKARRRRRASTCSAAARSCARASPRATCSRSDWGIAANVWSCPSFNQLARDGQDAERWNLLHPTERPRVPFVAQQLEKFGGPVIASTDYMKNYAEQIRAFLPKGRAYKVLGTDGFGRSDFRTKLREHFEIDRHYIVVAALKALAEEGSVPAAKVAEAIARYGIDADKINPLYA